MDIGGSQHDVHSSDCTQFTGKSLFQNDVDHHLSQFFLLFFALTSPVFTQSHSCGECGHVSPLLTSFFLIDCLSQGEQADAFCVSCVCSCGPACCNFPDRLGKGSFYNGPYRSS